MPIYGIIRNQGNRMADQIPYSDEYSTDSGVRIPDTAELGGYVDSAMQSIFGADMNIDSETSLGRIIEAAVMAHKNSAGVCAQSINQLNITSSSGRFLDCLASIYGLSRVLYDQSSSKTATVYSEDPAFLANGTVLADRFGNKYVVTSSAPTNLDGVNVEVGGSTVSLSSQIGDSYGIASATSHTWSERDVMDHEDVEIEAGTSCYSSSGNGTATITLFAIGGSPDVSGEIVGDLTVVTAASGSVNADSVFLITSDSTIGVTGESDDSLRKRIAEKMTRPPASQTGMANAIWKAVPSLTSVRVYHNDTDSAKTIHGISVDARCVLVCVSGVQSDAERNSIASAIIETLPAGAYYPMSLYAESGTAYRCNMVYVDVDGAAIDYRVVFFEPESITMSFKVSLMVNGYSGVSITADIESALKQYVAGKVTALTGTELAMALSASVKGVFVKNVVMYNSNGIEVSSVTPTLLQAIVPQTVTIESVEGV